MSLRYFSVLVHINQGRLVVSVDDKSYLRRGLNDHGQLAQPKFSGFTYNWNLIELGTTGNSYNSVASVAAGSGFVVAALTSGDVYSWGRNDMNQVCISR